MSRARVVVVGGGVGGLAAAIRLGAAGHEVTVLERRDRLGGKLDARTLDGFSFETGPSLLTLPEVFADLAAVAGTTLGQLVDLVRLDPVCRYRFDDGTGFDARASLDDTVGAVDELSAGQGERFRAFHRHGERVWEVAERTFFTGPMSSPLRLLRRMQHPRDLGRIDAVRTLHGRASSSFDDPRLVRYVDRYATYSGSSPYRAPATLSCIPYLEQARGAWYPMGGMGALRDALVTLTHAVGVETRTGAEVEAITDDGTAVTGVRLAGGEQLSADVVVANVDALSLYRDLLPDRGARRRAERAPRSSSGFVLLAGVRGRTEGLAHHNVSFSSDYPTEFGDLFDRMVPPSDPTVYVCCSAVTDPAQAPPGDENWFVLVNAPAAAGPMRGYGDHLLEVLAGRGWDLAGRIVARHDLSPADLAAEFRTPGGSIYGTASNGRAAAFLRPGNRGPRRGLYLVGGSSHPGGGLPLVALSGRIVADLVAEDRA